MKAVPDSFSKGEGARWETDAFFENGFQRRTPPNNRLQRTVRCAARR